MEAIEESDAQWDLLAYYKEIAPPGCRKGIATGDDSGRISEETHLMLGQYPSGYEVGPGTFITAANLLISCVATAV